MSFSEFILGEVCDVGSSKRIYAKEYCETGIPFYRSKEVIQKARNESITDELYISEEKYIELDYKFGSPKYGDILLASIGANLGISYFVNTNDKFYFKDGNVTWFRNFNKEVNSKFLYYWLNSRDGQNKLLNSAIGSAQKALTIDGLKKLKFEAPLFEEQKNIAETLSCLDDKIELNNRINKTLEEMAQAIFKSWFVDFEPFQDGEFENSELGKIPKGWRVGTIGELISDTLGGDWGKETSQGNYVEEVTCIRGADIPEIALGKRGKPATRFILKKNLEKKQLSEGQIIIEISGGSPTQSTGRTALITKDLIDMNDKPLICTNFCRALSLKKHSYSSFVYSILQYLYNIDLFFIYENGTTGIKNLDTNNLFNKYQITIPTDEIMLEYETVFSTLIKSIYRNGRQSDMLAAVRDTILPKLMSGEIRVPVEEV